MKSVRGISLIVAMCSAWGPVAAGDLVVDGLLVSNGGGVEFSDGSVQSSAAHPRWQRVAYVDAQGDGDYTDPAAAMADLESWCPGADPQAPCLVKVLPGDYDVGDTPVVMHPGVDLEGSGRNTTTVRGTVLGDDIGLVVLASFSEIRSLTLINQGVGAIPAVGIFTGSADPAVTDVRVVVSGDSGTTFGIRSLGGTPVVRRTEVHVTGGGWCYGVLTSDAAPLMDQADVWTSNPGGDVNFGIAMVGSAAPRLHQVRVRAEGGTQVVGIDITTSFATIERSTISASSTGPVTIVVGLSSGSGLLHRVTDCRIEASGGQYATGATVHSGSQVTMVGGEVGAEGASVENTGVEIHGSASLLRSSRVEAWGGQNAYGIRTDDSAAPALHSVTVIATNASEYTYGVYNDYGSTLEATGLVARASSSAGSYGVLNTNTGGAVSLDRCTVQGGSSSVRNDNSSVQFGVGSCKLIGTLSANLTCFGNYDDGYAAVTCP